MRSLATEQAEPWIAGGLILLGAVSRLVPHPWNVTPLTAIALFGGACLPRRWALLVPWTALALSDLLLGWHNTIPFTWGAIVLTGLIGRRLREQPGAGRIAAGCVSGSVLFFLVTNFGVWLVGGLYPRSADGLWQCYVAGIPFFRNSLLGDLVYTAALFTAYRLVASSVSRLART